jgi:hypothetical protein
MCVAVLEKDDLQTRTLDAASALLEMIASLECEEVQKGQWPPVKLHCALAEGPLFTTGPSPIGARHTVLGLGSARMCPYPTFQVNSRTHAPQEAYRLNSSMRQSCIDFKCPYSNRPFKPLTALNRLKEGFVCGTHAETSNPLINSIG